MDRRVFLAALGLLGAPLAAEAQQAGKVPQIGWLGNDPVSSTPLREAFRQGLRDHGYVEGRNLVIEYRDAEGKLVFLVAPRGFNRDYAGVIVAEGLIRAS